MTMTMMTLTWKQIIPPDTDIELFFFLKHFRSLWHTQIIESIFVPESRFLPTHPAFGLNMVQIGLFLMGPV